jgi:hypothetical protein
VNAEHHGQSFGIYALFRYLSPSIGSKRHFLTVRLTVKPWHRRLMVMRFNYLQVPEMIEWE